VSLSALFKNYETEGGGAQLIKAGESMEVARRGTRSGHTYHLLSYHQGPTKLFEPFLITIEHASETFPVFEHPGTEFIYMLEGRIDYRHGKTIYALQPGDALTFDGNVPHGPEKLTRGADPLPVDHHLPGGGPRVALRTRLPNGYRSTKKRGSRRGRRDPVMRRKKAAIRRFSPSLPST
jgi:mannose-6-phosphate isomerase-like protein (cupin superfamily)